MPERPLQYYYWCASGWLKGTETAAEIPMCVPLKMASLLQPGETWQSLQLETRIREAFEIIKYILPSFHYGFFNVL